MKGITLTGLSLLLVFLLSGLGSFAQCSICTRTAQQLGEGPAQGLNAGILYLAFLPLTIVLVVYYRWRKSQQS